MYGYIVAPFSEALISEILSLPVGVRPTPVTGRSAQRLDGPPIEDEHRGFNLKRRIEMGNDQLTLVLNQELAAEMGQPAFLEMMQRISAYEVQSSNIRVTNNEEYQMATDSLIAVAEVAKGLETMRTGIVAYPNTFTKTVNATFKTLKDRCLRTRERLEYHARKFKDKKDAEFAKQQVEAAAAAPEPSNVIDSDAAPEQTQLPLPPAPPMQSTKATDGDGSVSYRESPPQITVENAVKLIRAAINVKNKVPTDVISIDAAALRKAVNEGLYTPKQWAKYGVVIEKKEEMVVRT